MGTTQDEQKYRRFFNFAGKYKRPALFKRLVKGITILDFLLVFFLLPDLFLTPVPEPARLFSCRYGTSAVIYFNDGQQDEIKLDKSFKKTLNEKSSINVYYSPVFHIRKYFEGINKSSMHYRMGISEVRLPVIVILLNIAAVFVLFVFPQFRDPDKIRRRKKDPLAVVRSITRPYLMLLPALVSIGYWLQLLRFMFW